MRSFQESMIEYRKQLEQGSIQAAYRGLMDYILSLRSHLSRKHPDYFVSGSIYFGTMDMTYFSFTPKSIQDRYLKIAIVYLHEAFRFEVWLAGANKRVQSKYWKLFKESAWGRYRIVPSTQGADSIVEHIVAPDPNFSDLEALTAQIEQETLTFIQDVEGFLTMNEELH